MIKEFTYTSASGTKERKVLVLKENTHFIEGLDLNLLSAEDADFVAKTYKNIVPVTDYNTKVKLDGFNPAWNKAYRQFSKIKIKNS